MNPVPQLPILGSDGQRIDPETGLPLPDPFPEYLVCPHCGEAEVEIWCYQTGSACHNCGQWIDHPRPSFCGVSPYCERPDR